MASPSFHLEYLVTTNETPFDKKQHIAMAYRRLDYALAARSLPEDHPHAIHIKLPTPTRSTLTRKSSFIAKLKAKVSRRDLRVELFDDDAESLDSRFDATARRRYPHN